MEILKIIGAFVTLAGSIFIFLGALGVLRMPDIYNKIQAGTKATTLGTMLTLIGIAVLNPAWSGKIALLVLFIVFTNPVSSHVLARAAHFAGIPLTERTVVDKLKKKEDMRDEN